MWREMDGREPCPRCGKMLKPLSPAAKARYLKLDSLMAPIFQAAPRRRS